jgi:CHAT domain-containing protein/Flp pilus assembly protein TadD
MAPAAASLRQDAGSASPTMSTSSSMDKFEACHGPQAVDLAVLKKSSERYRRANDPVKEAEAVNSLGIYYAASGETKLSIPYLRRGSELFKRLGKPGQEAHLATLLSEAYNSTGNSSTATLLARRAVAIYQTLHDAAGESAATAILAEALANTDPNQANTAFSRALQLSIEAGDVATHASVLNDQGFLVQLSSPDQALGLFKQALVLEDTARDCRTKAAILANLASSYEQQGKPHEALDAYAEAVQLEQLIHNKSDEARIVHAEAAAYEDLGDFTDALQLFGQALVLERSTGDLSFEALTLSAIAGISNELGKPREAIRKYSAALLVLRKTRDVSEQAIALNNLATAYREVGLVDQARIHYHEAIRLAARSDNQITPAYSFWHLGQLAEPNSLPAYFRALHMAQQLDLPELEGLIDASLMAHYRGHAQYEVAIFFGKQAVERFQSIRHNMHGLGDSLVASFLQTKAQAYRDLAELLIERGRLAEASQILDLLKLQEYSDYARGSELAVTAPPTRTAVEDTFEQRYQELTTNIVEVNKQLQDLALDKHRTETKQAAYDHLREELRTADEQFDQYLHHLYLAFNDQDDANDKIQTIKRASSSLQDAIARAPGTVGIYVLQGETRLRLIVITGSQMVWRSYPISKRDLAEKCYDYLNVLSHPGRDPKAIAEELFNIVFAPIQKDVVASEGKTLVWHLDGPLRYIPMGALLDPKDGQFLIVHYNMVNYAAFNFYLTDKPSFVGVSAIAMGISRPYDRFEALPNVQDELSDIVTDPKVAGSHGQVSGTILLNDRFTWKAMDEDVGAQTIVHIASHFVLNPGSADRSYLLLAGKDRDSSGYHLSVADLKSDRDLNLAGKELVTLSACQTGSGTAEDPLHASSQAIGDGFEVEGVSDAILEKRAKSVISSLWSVNDQSTSLLMADFYRQWIGANGALTKIEALRRAQLDLLQGRARSERSGAVNPTDFSHPYYWAPFVLMGNWQ